jgi:hypothetical protein
MRVPEQDVTKNHWARRDSRTGAAEARLAVHGDEAGVSLGQLEELTDDLLGGHAAVDEVPARAR